MGAPHPGQTPTNIRWIVFALSCTISWMLYLHRYTFSLLKPYLQAEWGLSKSELGLLDSWFFLLYTGCQIPCAVLVDIIGAHFALGTMILVWSLFFALQVWAPDLAVMRIARIGVGVAQAGVYAAISRITKNWFPLSVRTTVQGWVGVFFGRIGGASTSIIFSAFLIGTLHFSWRTSVLLFSALGVVLAIAFMILFRDRPRNHPLVNSAEADLIEERHFGQEAADDELARLQASGQTKKNSIAQMFRRMSPRSISNLMWFTWQAVMSNFADSIYSSWMPMFLKDVHHVDDKLMGIYSALPLIGGAIGGVAGGWLADAVLRRTGNRRWSRSGVGFLGKGLAALTLVCALQFYNDPLIFCSMLFMVKFFSDCGYAVDWATGTDIGGEATATVYAFKNSAGNVASIFSPFVYGKIADNFGWQPIFPIVAGLYLLCALNWLVINCTIPVIREDASPAAS